MTEAGDPSGSRADRRTTRRQDAAARAGRMILFPVRQARFILSNGATQGLKQNVPATW
jgi:hypothetical protein